MTLPNHLFFTGVPGSHWSAIAQDLETIPGFNTSDRGFTRDFSPDHYIGHRGNYFGTGMEFSADIETMQPPYLIQHINSPWLTGAGTKIVKSHEWSLKLPFIKNAFPNDWIMLVYRPDLNAQAWWHEAGGFSGIKYPNYAHYKDSTTMLSEIMKQNKAMLQFAYENDATWSHYSDKWVIDNFGTEVKVNIRKSDILVTVIK